MPLQSHNLFVDSSTGCSLCPCGQTVSLTVKMHTSVIFLWPRLCTHMWRKKLFKVADFVLEIPPGKQEEWPSQMHEPLILAFVLPFLPFYPRHLRNLSGVLELGGTVRSLLDHSGSDVGHVLHQLCDLLASLASLSPSVV